MRIPGGLLFMWDVSPGFQNAVSVATSEKNPILVLQKWKMPFHGKKRKTASVAFLVVPRDTSVYDMGLFFLFIFIFWNFQILWTFIFKFFSFFFEFLDFFILFFWKKMFFLKVFEFLKI
jgi:hypothetical protein